MSDNEQREFSFRTYWGSDTKRCHVEYRRDRNTYCIYCGNEANTREHSPSKVFLRKPYPNDLPVLPACKECNNSFSDDELYSEVFIDALKYLSGYADSLSEENQERIFKNTAFSDAQKSIMHYFENGKKITNEKLRKILLKLSICHSIYELSAGYSGDASFDLTSLNYDFKFNLKADYINEFILPIDMTNKTLPELGSRVFENIRVIEPVLTPVSGVGDKLNIKLVIMLWTIIQNNNYEYIAWIDEKEINVKIIIHDFVFSHARFSILK